MMLNLVVKHVIATGLLVGMTLACSPASAAPPAKTSKELAQDYKKSGKKLATERKKLGKLRQSRIAFNKWVKRWNQAIARAQNIQYASFQRELRKAASLRNPPKERIEGEARTTSSTKDGTVTSTTRFSAEKENATAKVIGQFLGDVVEVNARKQLAGWEQQMRGKTQLVQKRWSLYQQAESKLRKELFALEKEHKRLRLQMRLARSAEKKNHK